MQMCSLSAFPSLPSVFLQCHTFPRNTGFLLKDCFFICHCHFPHLLPPLVSLLPVCSPHLCQIVNVKMITSAPCRLCPRSVVVQTSCLVAEKNHRAQQPGWLSVSHIILELAGKSCLQEQQRERYRLQC